MELGILGAGGRPVTNTVPVSWIGRPNSPVYYGSMGNFSPVQLTSIMYQLAYISSKWDEKKYDLENYTVGKYAITSSLLVDYGYINSRFFKDHGPSSMTYAVAWTNKDNIGDLIQFLTNPTLQDKLVSQSLKNNYDVMMANGTISDSDSLAIVSGMLYVSHQIGTGTGPTSANPDGTGAHYWRWHGSTNNSTYDYFNAGRYAIDVLSQQ